MSLRVFSGKTIEGKMKRISPLTSEVLKKRVSLSVGCEAKVPCKFSSKVSAPRKTLRAANEVPTPKPIASISERFTSLVSRNENLSKDER